MTRPNSCQGPNTSLPDGKYNQYTKNHQYPQRSYPNEKHNPRDKHNQNTHFLENQWNPKDWPTPMEVELARTLIRFFQVGSNGWGPARG